MPTLMQRGATWLGGKLKTAAGRSVVYSRGVHNSAAITGWVAKHEYEEIGDDGLTTSVVVDDWTFKATDVVVNGAVIEPRDGDVITETLNGITNEYTVLPLKDKKCFEWLDSSGLLLLIHTKRTTRES